MFKIRIEYALIWAFFSFSQNFLEERVLKYPVKTEQ